MYADELLPMGPVAGQALVVLLHDLRGRRDNPAGQLVAELLRGVVDVGSLMLPFDLRQAGGDPQVKYAPLVIVIILQNVLAIRLELC